MRGGGSILGAPGRKSQPISVPAKAEIRRVKPRQTGTKNGCETWPGSGGSDQASGQTCLCEARSTTRRACFWTAPSSIRTTPYVSAAHPLHHSPIKREAAPRNETQKRHFSVARTDNFTAQLGFGTLTLCRLALRDTSAQNGTSRLVAPYTK
eukprot:382608-Rhodomonas_salina.3